MSDEPQTCGIILKTVLMGQSQVGKTTLIERFIKDQFVTNFQSTIGVAHKTKIVDSLYDKPKLLIWDFGGQDQFKHVTAGFYNGAAGAQAVFDLNDRATLYTLQQRWFPEYQSNIKDSPGATGPFVIMGNKADLPRREVGFEEACTLARSLDSDYLETSAKTGQNVEASFTILTVKMLHKAGLGNATSTYVNQTVKEAIHPSTDLEGKPILCSACITLTRPPAYKDITPLELSHMIYYMDDSHYQEFLGTRIQGTTDQQTFAQGVACLGPDAFPEYRDTILPEHAYSDFVSRLPAFKPELHEEPENLVFEYR